MQIVTGTTTLKAEVAEIAKGSFRDPLTSDYVSELLVLPPIAGMEEIRFDWEGLHRPAEDMPYSEIVKMRLEHSRSMGDKCLAVGIFYLEDLERKGQYPLLDLGKSSYRAAAMYSNNSNRYIQGHIFSDLSENFFPAVAQLSYNMMRRLGNPSPPERIIILTRYGERIVLSRS